MGRQVRNSRKSSENTVARGRMLQKGPHITLKEWTTYSRSRVPVRAQRAAPAARQVMRTTAGDGYLKLAGQFEFAGTASTSSQ